jgi:ribosome-binding protein aMBF1 (putative translation factor)
MPRQRIDYNIQTYSFPDDFPERLRLFQRESGLSWSEIARRLETYRNIVWRWKEGLARPNKHHRKDLLELADSMALGHLFTE